ncbi:MAG: hypothetical protein IJ054_04835 [Lachnospiraceae bacterium]|nr:hypothetical protein [Lachnospiraceae bacterium]
MYTEDEFTRILLDYGGMVKRLAAIAGIENTSGAYMEFYKNDRALRGKRTVDKKPLVLY